MNDDTRKKLQQMLRGLQSSAHNRPSKPRDILSIPPGERGILEKIRNGLGQDQTVAGDNIIHLPEKGDFPNGWESTPIGVHALTMGFSRGYEEGLAQGRLEAWREADTVIDSIRNVLRLHDHSTGRGLEDDFGDGWDYDDEEF